MKARSQEEISLKSSLRLRSAELWLKLGEPLPALRELQQLSPRERQTPWALQVCRAVYRAVASEVEEDSPRVAPARRESRGENFFAGRHENVN